MVADLDTSEERILGFEPLPLAIRPKTVAERQIVTEDDDEDVREDFEQFLPRNASEAGDAEA
ncbi:Uncharacterised protein [Mycobacteroides abscessus subsp. abscessus]|nr:Uncharacterised protein [Mycobacteroides abscessus subsp. abscessus]